MNNSFIKVTTNRFSIIVVLVILVSACGGKQAVRSEPFTIAVIPDTQNALDYKRQRNTGFAIQSSDLFIKQMKHIAKNSRANGGDIAFVTAVGDVWQHQTQVMDQSHMDRGFVGIDNPFLSTADDATDKTLKIEIPKAVEGYRLLSEAGLPFAVAPGNHDYDAVWSDKAFTPDFSKNRDELDLTAEDMGMLHIGGLNNFRSVFGKNSEFFKNKTWYISSYNGGANSAQMFTAGGYTFLHFALEMQPADGVLNWVTSVIEENEGLPTIITTHDYLNARGERLPVPILDLVRLDPDEHNSAEELWTKLIRQHSQIFMVLCGHHHGQAMRVDKNLEGQNVYQILSDYQDRGQSALDKGQAKRNGRTVGTGDGWYRLMKFDLGKTPATIKVTTYSTHYNLLSSELNTYASWYKQREQPEMTDEQFNAADEFTIRMRDFRERFGDPE